MTKPARKHQDAIKPDLGTKERRAKGDVRITDALARSERKAQARSPLDRLKDSGKIDDALHQAGQKYAEHVHYAGLAGVARTADLLATGGGSGCTYGMAATEFQAHHRKEYRKAVQALGKWRASQFQAFVCGDCSLEKVGNLMGETNKHQAIAAAREMIIGKLHLLVDLWGMRAQDSA